MNLSELCVLIGGGGRIIVFAYFNPIISLYIYYDSVKK